MKDASSALTYIELAGSRREFAPEQTETAQPILGAMGLGKLLIAAGLLLVIAGLLVTFAGRLPLRLGRLPGDIYYQGKNSSFYFPITTCILLSVLISFVLWIIRR